MDQTDLFKKYWASVPQKEIADEILNKADKYYDYLSLSGRLSFYRRSWAYYYRSRSTGGALNFEGSQNELTSISVNHYRNLLLHLETMTCQQRAVFEPKATNSDVKSQSQVILAASLLDYYMREKKLNRNIKQAVKDCLIFAEGFVRAEWNPSSGDTYGKTATGAAVYQGDMQYTNYTPLDVIRDFTKTSPHQDDWFILRDFQNKYTLAAKFPSLGADILEASDDMLEIARTTTLNALTLDESDNILVYTLIHKPTPALPEGRFTTCLDNGVVMLDGPIPYKETHVYRIAPDEESGTIFGYSVSADLLPMQEGIDILYSTALTNQATFGVQNILIPKGHDLSTSQMGGGLNVMEYDPKIGKPEGLNLTSTPPEIFNFMQMIEKLMETISGVNSVARGNPEASLKSGAALALVQSMAIQFSMGLQQSYAQLVEDLGTGTIKILQDFAAVPRVAAIAGKSNRSLMKEFTGQDLNAINRVMVDMGNPMTATIAGKTNLADLYLEKGLVENPDQYVQVVTTGRLEPIIQGKQSQLLLIKGENEGLAEGRPQRAVITDDHAKHVLEHGVVNASSEARADPASQIMQVTLDHIQEHLNFAMSPGYQAIAQMLQHQVMSLPPQPASSEGMGEPLAQNNFVTAEAEQVQQPNMPNPPENTDAASAAIIEAAQ